MSILRRTSLAAAALLTLASATISPTAAVAQSYSEDDIVYTYYYYSDPEKTDLIEVISQVCGDYGPYFNRPFYSSPYYDREPLYVCTPGGPYDPGDRSPQ